MTIITLEPKETSVDLRLRMTVTTLLWSVSINTPLVTFLAIYLDMATIQLKVIRMVKILHTVDPIMTLKTILAKLGLMLVDEFPVILSMAFSAGSWIKFPNSFLMATITGDGHT